MKLGRHLMLLAVALVLAASVACDANDPAGPSDAASIAEKPHIALSRSKTATPTTGTLTEEQLKEWELSEKARLAAVQEASEVVYDSLKLEWKRLLKLYPDGDTGESGPVFCDPLQHAGDVKIIGPEGGDMSIGPHKLSIPAGALTNSVVITGEMPVSLAVTVKLSPHGLVFAKQPKLTLSYKHCLRPTNYRERVAYTDEKLRPLEFPRSSDRTLDGLIDAWLGHFSRYAVWY